MPPCHHHHHHHHHHLQKHVHSHYCTIITISNITIMGNSLLWKHAAPPGCSTTHNTTMHDKSYCHATPMLIKHVVLYFWLGPNSAHLQPHQQYLSTHWQPSDSSPLELTISSDTAVLGLSPVSMKASCSSSNSVKADSKPWFRMDSVDGWLEAMNRPATPLQD